MKTITTKEYYNIIKNNQPNPKRLVDTMTKQLQVIRIMKKPLYDVCDEFRERTIQQAKNIIRACQMVEKDIMV